MVGADGNQIQANAPANAITATSADGALVVTVTTEVDRQQHKRLVKGHNSCLDKCYWRGTQFIAPEPVSQDSEENSVEVVVVVEMGTDGSMTSNASYSAEGGQAVAQELKVSDAGLEAKVSVGGVEASVVSPPGTAAVPTATGGVTITPPAYTPASGGPPVQITIPISSSGKTSPKIPTVEGREPVVLPAVSGDVSVVTGDDGVPEVQVTTSELTPPLTHLAEVAVPLCPNPLLEEPRLARKS